MEEAIKQWMRAVVDTDTKRQAFMEEEKQRVLDNGGIWITWSGGGNCEENRISNAETGEELAVIEDTWEAFEELWDQHPEWHNSDTPLIDGYDKYPTPEAPAEFAWFINEDREPEDFRTFLSDYYGE